VELAGAAARVAEDKDLKKPFVLRIQVLDVNITPVPHLTKGVHYMKILSSLVQTAQEDLHRLLKWSCPCAGHKEYAGMEV
jgi:hypothetical protein